MDFIQTYNFMMYRNPKVLNNNSTFYVTLLIFYST